MADRKRLPNRRKGLRVVIENAHVSTGDYPDGSLGEIFNNYQKEGSFTRDIFNAFAMAVSLGLQHGIPLSAFIHTYRSFKMDPDIVRQVFAALQEHYGGEK
jgi:ribonucleoside-diphosphate reductase alpha chain